MKDGDIEDDKFDGCGISKIWGTPVDDVFELPCAFHDEAYVTDSFQQRLGMKRKQVDRMFLAQMLRVAEDDKFLIARAYFFYGLARLFGGRYWEGK